MKKILLTGGNGFIGKNIKESYLSEKYEILAPSSCELNLTDEHSVDDFFLNHRVDIVLHGAIKPGHRNSVQQSGILYPNIRMFINLERHSSDYEKMIVFGSGAVYDNRNYEPKMKEDHYRTYLPADEYGFGKYLCSMLIDNSQNLYDFRLFGIFGKYEDYAIRFISNAICKSIFGLPITIRQDRLFDYLYIDDLMPILEYFIDNTPQFHSYNITPHISISLVNIATYIKEITKNPHPLLISNSGQGLEYSGDNTRLLNEFSSLKFTEIKEAINLLYLWYLKHKGSINKDLLLIDK